MSSVPKKVDDLSQAETPESTATSTNLVATPAPSAPPDSSAKDLSESTSITKIGIPLAAELDPTPPPPPASQLGYVTADTDDSVYALDIDSPPDLTDVAPLNPIPAEPPAQASYEHPDLTLTGINITPLDELTQSGVAPLDELTNSGVAAVDELTNSGAAPLDELTHTGIINTEITKTDTVVDALPNPPDEAVTNVGLPSAPDEAVTNVGLPSAPDEVASTQFDASYTSASDTIPLPAENHNIGVQNQYIDIAPKEEAVDSRQGGNSTPETTDSTLSHVAADLAQTVPNQVAAETAQPAAPNAQAEAQPAQQPTREPTQHSPRQPIFGKNAKRIALAAAISTAGFVLTFAWYEMGAGGAHISDSKPIAKIVRSVNEVQRKPITKLIWQPILEKDTIYAGEAIRTAANAEATIEFIESGTKIDLDPDSAIVLEESAGKLALNFLQGNLFVKAGDKAPKDGSGAAADITVKTGEKQIALGNSEISLNKTSSGDLDLQVLKGQAQVVGDGKTLTLDQGKSLSGLTLTLLKPAPGESIYIDPELKEKVTFEWQPLTQGDYTVTLEAGPTRQTMKPVANAVGGAGKLEAELKPGRFYYRLVAKASDPAFKELASATLRNTILAKTPPQPITPENETQLAISQEQPSVPFIWSNPANWPEVHIKLSRSPDFKSVIFQKSVQDGNEVRLDLKSSGRYYWQLTGRVNDKDVALSKVASFDVTVTKGLPAPHLQKPVDHEKFPYDIYKNNGLTLSWEPVANAHNYRVTITGLKGEPQVIETKLLQANPKDLPPGIYTWSVASLDDKGEVSPNPEQRTFALVELPQVPWADGKTSGEYEYITLKPTLELQWLKPEVPGATVARYQVHVVDAEDSTKSLAQAANNLSSVFQLEKDGEYFAEVEAVDAAGKAVARSTRRKVKVTSAPLLPPPQFAESLPTELVASGRGSAQLTWTNVQGAAKYMVILKDEKGEPKRELAFTGSEAELRGLMPGDYQVVLRSVDQHGRPGPEGEARALKVPSISNVAPPKLKGLKVK